MPSPYSQQGSAACRKAARQIKLERTFEDLASALAAVPSSSAHVRLTAHTRAPDTRFDRRLAEILDYATEVFAEKGYEGASMRDLSRLSGISLAGLYYYFESKEKLLYFIQQHTFTTIIERLAGAPGGRDDPEARIRIFVHNHVDYCRGQAESHEGAVA